MAIIIFFSVNENNSYCYLVIKLCDSKIISSVMSHHFKEWRIGIEKSYLPLWKGADTAL